MASIAKILDLKSTNTSPELLVRSFLHRLGFRFRLHRRFLPGCPDILFPSRKKIIFVHGCFWHGHPCARGHRIPKSNTPYWLAKIARNQSRDRRTRQSLRRQGWKVLILWECQLQNTPKLSRILTRFLAPPGT
jgi:DNA mismatch endonuclease, patch repair protein